MMGVQTMSAMITTEHPTAPRFRRELERVQTILDGQVLVSQDRCVDALLDLYNVAPSALVRALIGNLLSDMRFVSAVRARYLAEDLSALGHYAEPGPSRATVPAPSS